MKPILLLTAGLLLWPAVAVAQYQGAIYPLAGEHWWGGATALGTQMPFGNALGEFNLSRDNLNNQVSPLLLSDQGRYFWSDRPFHFRIDDGRIGLSADSPLPSVTAAGTTLREAFLAAAQAHFPPSGLLPDTLFFTRPQYNTWIELMYDQNQADILGYAHAVVDNGLPTGVLMIDDNWQRYYGNFDFRRERFSDPRGMVDELHRLGFRVMLWICPFVSADSPEYRDLRDRGFLISTTNGQPAIIEWWNGQSACYDLTNPAARDHFVGILKDVQEKYGIDGFKFDAGDNQFYDRTDLVSSQAGARSVDHTRAWAMLGLQFPFNEYRACWQMGGQPLVQRLGDKDYSWEAVGQLIPDMIAAGLLGHAFACPDMIGGGQFKAFLNIDPAQFNQRLVVRSAQVHALMPMMQFSVAPWRILSEENMQIVRRMARLHEQMGGYILSQARHAAATGEPIVRSLEYMFPHQGYAAVTDQFMLGDRYMVAPVIDERDSRTVVLPPGRWRDDEGRLWRGGRTVEIAAPLSRLPWFERIR